MKSRESNGHSTVEVELETDEQSDGDTSVDCSDTPPDEPNVQDFRRRNRKEESNSIESGKRKQAKLLTSGGQLLSKPGFNSKIGML